MVGPGKKKAADRKETDEVKDQDKESGAPADVIQEAAAAYDAARGALEQQRLLREANTSAKPLADDALKGRDSSIKRNNALLKKLRALSEDTKQAVLDDIQKVNQSRYVTEAVAAVAEAPVKAKDIPAVVQVCSVLHQQYAEFGSGLVRAFGAVLAAGAADGDQTLTRRRTVLRLLAQLLQAGVSDEWAVLVQVIQQMAGADFRKGRQEAVAVATILAAFAKAERSSLLGFPARDPATLPVDAQAAEEGAAADPRLAQALAQLAAARAAHTEEAARRFLPPPEVQKGVRAAFRQLFAAACDALEREHGALLAKERQNTRTLTSRGDLPEAVAEAFEAQRQAVEALQRPTAALAEQLEAQLPVLPESDAQRTPDGSISVIVPKDAEDFSGGVFEDEDTRTFYEVLPGLRSLLPPSAMLDAADAQPPSADAEAAELASDAAAPDGDAAPNDEGEVVAEADSAADADDADGATEDGAAGESVSSGAAGAARAAEVRAVIGALPTCVTREQCDALAENFVLVQSKAARKRMMRALCEVPRHGLQLLPYYARITAALAPLFPEIGQGVEQHLESQFKLLQRRRDAAGRDIEARLGNVRFLGELTKFRLVPYGALLSRLKLLLDDFSGPNVEAAAALLDTAGRFLYRTPETHDRMASMAEIMMKLKSAKNLDARQAMLLEHAYFQVRPPERMALPQKLRPPLHAFIRHLLRDVLAPDTLHSVLRKMRKLPWAENEPYLVRGLLSASRGRAGAAALLASLTAGLSRYHPSLGVRLVDALLEDIRTGLETPQLGRYQRQVGQVRLLGEAYNYRLLPSRVVLDSLHLVLAAGHAEPATAARIDPPTSYFRIRLVAVLLETCGHYFGKGSAARQLDRFLAYLQRYLLSKPPAPLDVSLDLQDLLESLRPGFQWHESYEAAAAAVDAFEAADAAAQRSHGGLSAIAEDEEGADDSGSDEASSAAGSGDEGVTRRRAPEERGPLQGGPAGAWEEEGDDEAAAARVLRAPPQEADEDFERDFAELMGGAQPQGQPAPAEPGAPSAAAPPSQPAQPQQAATMSFKVMLRRGGREDRSREVQVPVSSAVAAAVAERAAAEAAERAHIKRLTLQASSAQDAQAQADELRSLRASLGSRQQSGGGHHSRQGHPAEAVQHPPLPPQRHQEADGGLGFGLPQQGPRVHRGGRAGGGGGQQHQRGGRGRGGGGSHGGRAP